MRTVIGVVVALVLFGIGWLVVAFVLSVMFSIPIPRINDPDADSFLNKLKIWVFSPGLAAGAAMYFSARLMRPLNLRYLLVGFLTPVALLAAFGLIVFGAGALAQGVSFAGAMEILVFVLQMAAIVGGAFVGRGLAADE